MPSVNVITVVLKKIIKNINWIYQLKNYHGILVINILNRHKSLQISITNKIEIMMTMMMVDRYDMMKKEKKKICYAEAKIIKNKRCLCRGKKR